MKKFLKCAFAVLVAASPLFSCEKPETVEDSVSVVLDKSSLELTVGDTFVLEAEVSPSEKAGELQWASSDPETVSVEDGKVTALKEGEAVVSVSAGGAAATCSITVLPLAAPKVGDYLYEDGTWSDGGLVSIGADGLNPVWADVKPAPKAGKKVIGIVFQTDPARIAESDKAAGYVNGYAVAVRFAHGTEKATTFWSRDYDFSCLKGAKLASTWYGNVNGREETGTVSSTYGDTMADNMPAFDCVLNGFSLTAPAGTSGWFLPSTGQLWDMAANLCGHEVAGFMKEWQTYDYDATWYCSENVSYDALARFNDTMSEIPDEDKDELVVNDSSHPFCSLWASTPYDSESACIINIGTDGLIECMCDWYDADCYARPILAF